ncbi:MAG: ABC transporter ATP-binding protein [Chloroflexota bacterium]
MKFQLLKTYLLPHKWRLVQLSVLLFSGIGLQLFAPQLMRRFLDGAQTGAAMSVLLQTAVFFFIVTVIQKFVNIGTTYVSQDLGWTATNQLRADLAQHVLRLDMGFHKMRTPGELIERIDGDVEKLAEYFSSLIIQLFGNAVLAVGILLLLWRENWQAGLVGLVYGICVITFLRLIQNMVVGVWKSISKGFAEMFGFVEERIVGTEDIRANGGELYVINRLLPILYNLRTLRVKAIMLGNTSFSIGYMLYVLSLVAILAIGANLYLQGVLTIGAVYLLVYYVNLLENPLNAIRRNIGDLQQAIANISRISELLTVQPKVVEQAANSLPEKAPTVDFRNVSFGYRDGLRVNGNQPENDDLVLQDIDFSLPAGRILGVLGRTGSGKTTLTRLLFRLYDVDSGTISLDETDVHDVRLSALRSHIGMVTQDVQLFAASVRDNLTLFRNYNPSAKQVDDGEITAVLHNLGLGDWLASLPDGLDTTLAAGGKGLSAGQAQLLAFARVFLHDPKLVILDEASSRLDPATEQLLERAIDQLLENRTGIIIAHRLKTVQRADDILVLENGRIVEHGERIVLASDPTSRFYQLLQTGLEEVLA